MKRDKGSEEDLNDVRIDEKTCEKRQKTKAWETKKKGGGGIRGFQHLSAVTSHLPTCKAASPAAVSVTMMHTGKCTDTPHNSNPKTET